MATFQRDHASRVSSFSYIQCELKGLSLLENKKLLWFLNEKCKIIRSDFTRLNVTFFTINQRHLKDYFIKIAILNCYLRSVLHASRRQYMSLTHSKLILKKKIFKIQPLDKVSLGSMDRALVQSWCDMCKWYCTLQYSFHSFESLNEKTCIFLRKYIYCSQGDIKNISIKKNRKLERS